MRLPLLRYTYIALLFVFISSCSSTPKIKKVETSMIEMNSATITPDDSIFINTVQPFKVKMDSIMNEVLGSSDQPLLKGLPEGALGSFVSDAVLKKTNDHYKPSDNIPVDICLLNNG